MARTEEQVVRTLKEAGWSKNGVVTGINERPQSYETEHLIYDSAAHYRHSVRTELNNRTPSYFQRHGHRSGLC